MGYKSEEGLAKAYSLLEAGKPAQAKQVLEEDLPYNLENTDVKATLWCCSFWTDFITTLPSLDDTERGEGLITHWKSFHAKLENDSRASGKAVQATERGVFTLALHCYTALEGEGNGPQRAETYRKIGLCHKKLGNYADALTYLTSANEHASASAQIIAEMADCYALCGEEKTAKVLFREAFFIDAQSIDLAFLDSELICSLIRKVQEKGYAGAPLQEWIPVYGVLYGVLNVKRPLRSQEVGKLKQDIYAKENELHNPSSDIAILTPQLINMYFWLVDHYVQTGDSRERINEVLLKIKMRDRDIYTLYNVK